MISLADFCDWRVLVSLRFFVSLSYSAQIPCAPSIKLAAMGSRMKRFMRFLISFVLMVAVIAGPDFVIVPAFLSAETMPSADAKPAKDPVHCEMGFLTLRFWGLLPACP